MTAARSCAAAVTPRHPRPARHERQWPWIHLDPLCAPVSQRGGLRHLRIRPYTPRTNGKAECFIQMLLREWAYRRAYPSSHQPTEALLAWLYYCNNRQRGPRVPAPTVVRPSAAWRPGTISWRFTPGRGAGPGDQPQVMKLTVAQSVIRDAETFPFGARRPPPGGSGRS